MPQEKLSTSDIKKEEPKEPKKPSTDEVKHLQDLTKKKENKIVKK